MFAETGTSSLWTLALHHIPPRIDGSLMKIKLDVSLFLETGGEERGYAAEKVAGSEGIKSEQNSYLCVRELAWSFDRRGQRLALTVSPRIRTQDGVIDDAPATLPGDELIIIYNVFFRPKLRVSPSGFLRSSADAGRPYDIHFWPACRNGALLASAWANGAITVYPLLYRSPSSEE